MTTDRLRGERAQLALLLVGAALVFAWRLDVSGYANSYYSAAAQAGSESWKAMFFGSLDSANAITVDKPPMALWPMALSVRLFGMSSWSILLPQALEGIASVALLHACIRRATGAAWPALLGGVVFTVTPVAVLVFRYNNPDALLTLLLLGSAYATLRAVESQHAGWWLALAGALIGLGFLTKMFEAFLVVPALALTYARYGPRPVLARLAHLAAGLAAIALAAGWWVTVVELWPIGRRPFIGGSTSNSVVELALGYNGLGRVTGSDGTSTTTVTGLGATNLARIGRTDLGAEITWLVPAVIGLGLLAWGLSRRHSRRDILRPSLLLWTTWLGVVAATFAVMVGIFHSYYTVVLAPAIAAVIAIGSWLAWERRDELRVRRVLGWSLGATTLLSGGTILVVGEGLRWTALPVLVGGVVAAARLHPRSGPRQLTTMLGLTAVLVSLAGPALFSLETVRLPHVGSGPMAGPMGGAPSAELVVPTTSSAGLLSTFGYGPISAELLGVLGAGAEEYRWAAATFGARSASAYQLALDEPVLAIGGYKGTDPTPTLPEFQAWVRSGQVHWLVAGGTSGPAGAAIQSWVATRFPSRVVDGRALYDLTAGT